MTNPGPAYILGDAAPRLDSALRSLLDRRIVCFAGLPATGKSLLVQQMALLAVSTGRVVRTLQWDVARPALQACQAAQSYPDVDGITPSTIIRATGRWARGAVERWAEQDTAGDGLLIVEAPLIGGRFQELADPTDDAVETLLTSETCQFVLVEPTAEVRAHIEAERARRHRAPQHVLEREDAAPDVLRLMWRDLLELSRTLGIEVEESAATAPTFEAGLYRLVYERLLRHRRVQVLELDTVLPAGELSVYEAIPGVVSLVPTLDEAEAAVEAVTRGKLSF